MFSKDGYLSPIEVMRAICRNAGREEVTVHHLPENEEWIFARREFWLFADELTHCYLMDRDGAIIKGDARYAQSFIPKLDCGPYDGAPLGDLADTVRVFNYLEKYSKFNFRLFSIFRRSDGLARATL